MKNEPIFIFPLYLVTAILNFIVFDIYLRSTGLPGGAVGMVPLVVMLYSLICFIASLILFLLLRKPLRLDYIKAVILYQFVYVVILIIAGENPYDYDLEKEFKEITFWLYAASLIASVLMLSILILKKLYKRT